MSKVKKPKVKDIYYFPEVSSGQTKPHYHIVVAIQNGKVYFVSSTKNKAYQSKWQGKDKDCAFVPNYNDPNPPFHHVDSLALCCRELDPDDLSHVQNRINHSKGYDTGYTISDDMFCRLKAALRCSKNLMPKQKEKYPECTEKEQEEVSEDIEEYGVSEADKESGLMY